jgi:transposase
MVLEGSSREDAARQAGMDRQILRAWVLRYNELGADGLVSRAAPGPAAKLSEAQMNELRDLVIAGLDPAIHQVVRWRCVDLRDEVACRFGVTVAERTVGKWLRKLRLIPAAVDGDSPPSSSAKAEDPRLSLLPPQGRHGWSAFADHDDASLDGSVSWAVGMTRLQPRPVHPKKDPAAEAAFQENFGSLLKEALLGSAAGGPVEIWFQDEARVGQQGTHAYIWAPIGARPLMVRNNRHD